MKELLVSFGSNIGSRETHIQRAAALLAERVGRLCALSSLRETAPWGFSSDNAFLNACAIYHTSLSATALLDASESVERELGRTEKTTGSTYHDRTIDVDLLALGDEVVQSNRLTLPHPAIARRRFVLEPLCEVAAEAVHPVLKKSYRELLALLNHLAISEAAEATAELVCAVNRLLPGLSSSAPALTESELSALIANPSTHLFVGQDEEGNICGMATLCLTFSPTGCKAWVEDVVVDAACRGRGYGRQLVAHVAEASRRSGARSLNLTSRPERTAANALYRSLGFKARATNVYRLD
ncbi:MAG: 2-amino-4-hydroxy-6-hydroxymethyldihydropteridine diphosphokinase [Bacteroidaceae bacterium]|nr:2-amino-4-hydroxy-6-hydroxymethyldihydropteridine diphosphokinase [Bacteroidaceae bacterium]